MRCRLRVFWKNGKTVGYFEHGDGVALPFATSKFLRADELDRIEELGAKLLGGAAE